jgi:hypothetical protein
MKLNNSNKRISNIIAGILLVFVAFIFIALALGYTRDNLYLQDKMDLSDPSLVGNIGKNNYVPIAQNCPDVCLYDTLPGSIEVVAEDLVEDFEFPLCFDANSVSDFVNAYYRIYKVCGHYTLDGGEFNLYQQNKETGELVKVSNGPTVVGWGLEAIEFDEDDLSLDEFITGTHDPIPMDWYDPQQPECCCTSYWVVILDTSCNNGGCLDSNQWPDVPDGCTLGPTFSAKIPGKDIHSEIKLKGYGCPLPGQRFVIILVQISRIPNSRINI